MRRRKGLRSSDVLESKCILVSRNSTFAHFSQKFVIENLVNYSFSIGPVIETKTLSAITWMRFGSDAGNDFPEISLIATCDRILASNGVFLRKAEKKLRTVAEPDIVDAILSSQQSVLDLVIGVGANPEVIDGAEASELLRTVTSTAEERGREIERKRTEKVANELRQEKAERERENSELTAKAQRLAAEKQSNLVIAENFKNAESARRCRLCSRVQARATKLAWLVTITVWLSLIAATLYLQFAFWSGPDMWKSNPMLALITFTSTLLLLLSGLRFLPKGPDFVEYMHRFLEKKSIEV